MALRWIDSFDHMSTVPTANGSSAALESKYDPAEAYNVWITSTARTGSIALAMPTLGTLVTKPLGASGTTAIVGVAFFMPAGALTSVNGTTPMVTVQEDAIRHMNIGIDYNVAYGSAFKLTVMRGTTVLATTTATYQANTWLYLEFKVTIHASAGSYELRVDTVPVLTGSGVNTSNGGTGNWNRVGFYGCMTGSVWIYFDDLYVCDGSGATRNTFLGIQRVESVLMKTDAAGAGALHAWTPSSGTDHGAMVDESAPDDDTTYNAATGPAQDTYQHVALTLSGVINGVQVNPYWKKTDSGACTARALTRVAGVTYNGVTQSPLTTYSVMPDLWEKNPNTGTDWTVATVNAAEFGVERLT